MNSIYEIHPKKQKLKQQNFILNVSKYGNYPNIILKEKLNKYLMVMGENNGKKKKKKEKLTCFSCQDKQD